MKKITVALMLLLFINGASAQIVKAIIPEAKFLQAAADTSDTEAGGMGSAKPKAVHEFHGKNGLSFSQISYSDSWESGGVANLTLRATSNLSYVYKKSLWYFQSELDGAYAMTWDNVNNLQKKEDRFQFTNTCGLRTGENSKFYYTALVDLKSQFSPGYRSPADRTIISRLFSPAYLTTSLGMSFKGGDTWNITVAPVSGRFTFVLDTTISRMGIYTDVKMGETTAVNMGFYAGVIFKKEFLKTMYFNSKMELFSNYTDNPQNIDIDWENKLGIKITSFLAAELYCRMVYKDKSRYTVPGSTVLQGPRLQVHESFNIGLTYSF
ncbi:MAG: DUF3078 domain-containing protein [Bacteroidales bacterium]|nr:DUF3078 domain-containing protein [Bacteroidales bacterium]MCL2133527.1 DUF3078 domain-containing protein [Bacteroidales bacterium]MCL2133548.1 DUF3078 domain-containing protein [Bacteroidales bacterium]